MSKDRMSVTFEGRNMQELVEKIFGFLNVLKLSTGGQSNDEGGKAEDAAGASGGDDKPKAVSNGSRG